MIDNYDEAIALMEKLKAHLPICLKPTPESAAQLRDEGLELGRNLVYELKDVVYSGDMGGILCQVKHDKDDSIVLMSLTHLRIDRDHPLAAEVEAYQHHRILKLALADGKMGKASRLRKKAKKKKGFGVP